METRALLCCNEGMENYKPFKSSQSFRAARHSTFDSVYDASKYITEQWPEEEHGPKYLNCLEILLKCLEGGCTAAVARVAFVEAAREAGIYVEPMQRPPPTGKLGPRRTNVSRCDDPEGFVRKHEGMKMREFTFPSVTVTDHFGHTVEIVSVGERLCGSLRIGQNAAINTNTQNKSVLVHSLVRLHAQLVGMPSLQLPERLVSTSHTRGFRPFGLSLPAPVAQAIS